MDVNDSYKTFNPWLVVLMYEEWYMDIVKQKWTENYDSGLFDRVYEMIENDTKRYSKAFDRNYAKWNNIVNNSAFVNELSTKSAACKTHKEASKYLSKWLKTRVEYLNSQLHL